MTIGEFEKLMIGMREITAALDGVDINDSYDVEEQVCGREVHIIQGNTVKQLSRIAADVKDGKIESWELIFQEGGRK